MTVETDFGLSLNTHDWGNSFGVASNRTEQMHPNWILLLHGGESHRLRPYSARTNFIQREDANDGARRFLKKYEGENNDLYTSSESYANRRFPQVNELDFIQPFNEIPSLANSEHAKWYVEWCLDFMEKRCIPSGRRAAIGTVPVTTLDIEGWAGIIEVLKVISARPDLFRWLITDYSNGFMASGANSTYPPHFKDDKGKEFPADGWYKFSPTDWSHALDLSKRQWIAGRWTEMLLACEAAGFDPPPTVCIETGVDVVDKTVVEQWTKHLLKRSGYTELRGWRSYERQWTEWIKTFPDPYNKITWVQYHLYGRLWQRDVVYRPYKRANGDCVVESSLDFMGTLNDEWEKGFNTMDREFDPFYQGYLEDRSKPYALPWRKIEQPDPEPIPTPLPVPPYPGDSRYETVIFKTTGANTILREYPTVTSKELARIVADEVQYIPVAKLEEHEKHHDQLTDGRIVYWFPTILRNMIGFVREDVVEVLPLPPKDEPPPTPEPPLPPEIILEQDVAFLKSLISETEKELTPAQEQLDHYSHIVARLHQRIDGLKLVIGDLERFISSKAA